MITKILLVTGGKIIGMSEALKGFEKITFICVVRTTTLAFLFFRRESLHKLNNFIGF